MKIPNKIKFVFILLFFAILYFSVDKNQLVQVLSNFSLFYFILLLLLSVLMIWVSSRKWQVFVWESGKKVSIALLMKLYTMGYFFNTFAPSYLGGDVARSIQLGEHLGDTVDGFSVTFLERFTGFVAMSLMALLSLFFGAIVTFEIKLLIVLINLISLVLTLVVFSKGLSKYFFSFLLNLSGSLFSSTKIESFLKKTEEGISFARGNVKLFFVSMSWAFLFHILTVVNAYLAAYCIGWKTAPIMELFVVVPIVLLVTMIPITPAGLGITEGAFTYFLARIGATSAEGLAVAIVLRLKVVILAVVGAFLWLNYKNKKKEKI